MKITVETVVAAPVAEVWRAWTTPADIVQWNAASDDWHTTRAEVDLRVGGAFSSRMEARDGSMGFDFAGTYTRVDEHALIECSFGERTLRVEFIAGDGGVTVRETFDAETTFPPEQQRQGWQAILDSFARHVQAGRAAGPEPAPGATAMLEASCHCGAVAWTFDGLPEGATACNCTVCRRYGVLWAYGYEGHGIRVSGPTTAYIRGRAIEFHFCPTCGCVAYWRARATGDDGRRRIAVNLRLAEPGPIARVPIDRFDGLDSFDDLPRDGRCVADYWF